MTESNHQNGEPPAKRGGLGRGLGALIPSAPLGSGGASGKGHFWSALDNPPAVDEDAARNPVTGELPTPSAAREIVDNVESAGQAAESNGSGGSGDAAAALAHPMAHPVDEPVDADVSGDAAEPDVSRETGGEPPAVLIDVDLGVVRANPKNPRTVFDDDELTELSESIKEFGLLQPIVVRQSDDGYELIMGERRLRAARLAGLSSIPAIVRQTDDDAMLRDALLENIHRVQLHPLEEAAAYQQLIDEFGVTHEQLAQRIKRSRPVISNTIRLLKLPTRVQNRVAAGVISGSHARALLALDEPEAQEALATRIVAEGLSVRATEEAVAMHGTDGPARRAPRKRTVTAPALNGLAERLSDHFDTRALVQLGRSKGKIVIEFASIDDLERIIALMAPHLATNRRETGGSAGPTSTDAGADPTT